jgi:hypothetical protein
MVPRASGSVRSASPVIGKAFHTGLCSLGLKCMGGCIGLILDLGRSTPAGEMLNLPTIALSALTVTCLTVIDLLSGSTMAVEPLR